MRLSVTLLGLDLFTLDLTTGDLVAEEEEAAGDYLASPITPGFCLVERDGGSPELVQ